MTVGKATWWRRHPAQAGLAGVLGAVVLAAATVALVVTVTRPALECGSGMTANRSATACIGIDLNGDRISPHQPARLGSLVARIKTSNDAVTGTNYASIVLLQNLSPVENEDTTSYSGLYQDIEGAITAVWQANNTATFSGSATPAAEPKIKLFLANMGSRNADWEEAVDQIARQATANHITSVAGLGQSTDNTRWAATKLITSDKLPVIGSTVTGDKMNFSMRDGTRLAGFFRVSATNSDTVAAAATYLSDPNGLNVPAGAVAIVQDMVASDDYVVTLGQAANSHLGAEHRFQFTSPDISVDSAARADLLKGPFGYLDINLCAAKPKVVYFAGRGADVPTFVSSWLESHTECSTKPLTVLTGDDGIEAVRNDRVADAVSGGGIRVQYTGLASPGKWGTCPAESTAATERAAFDEFEAIFTGKPACHATAPTGPGPLLAYPVEDLDSGQAILTHDAIGLAATTVRRTGLQAALTNPMSQVGVLQQTRCTTVFPGASGTIQFSADPQYYGNPIGTSLPIEDITKDERAVTIGPARSTGGPSPTAGC